MSSRLPLVVGVLVGAAGLVASVPARAEAGMAPPTCGETVKPSAMQGEVPANLPAFVVVDGFAGSALTSTLDGPGAPFTLTEKNDIVPGVRQLVLPPGALEEGGVYSLAVKTSCSSGATSPGTERTFKATAAVPLPTTVGTIDTAGGPVTPSLGVAAFAATTRFDVAIDGKPLGTTAYDVVSSKPFAVAGARGYVKVGTGTVRSATGTQLCDTASELETHQVTLVGRIAGVAAGTEPLTFPVSFACEAPASSAADAGTDDRASAGSSDEGGCAVGPGNLSISGVALVGAAAAVLVRLRRRRR